jgi:hypothetical protein
MAEMRNASPCLESLRGRDHSEDLGTHVSKKLKLTIGKSIWRVWIGFI